MSTKRAITTQTRPNVSSDANLDLLLTKEKVEELEIKIEEQNRVLGYWKVKHDKLKRDYYQSLSDNERVLHSVVRTAKAIMSDPSLSNAMAVSEWRAWCKTRRLLESQTHDQARALMPPPPPRDPKRRKLD
tara:strand:- start:58 stop:450 length:393 start_codon:yes stop_codon:yes gene_type:complete